ncbi:MAG: GGDEF domain-containing protein [Lachnospiraceae bacterium]|nr:GGDEF domain-containing protein [Lachnospiraceae bacterium]
MTDKPVNKKFKYILMVISVVAAIVVIRFVYVRFFRTAAEQRTHERINSYIDEELQYDESLYDQEIEDLNGLLELSYISDADKGHVYERLAQIYKFRNDTLLFYHTLGNALYYLERGGNKSVAVNIYEDIANYYITDNNFPQAEKILATAYEVCPIEDIPDKQVKSYALRMQAIVLRHDGDTGGARKCINESSDIARECSDTFWYESYLAINSTVLAGIAMDEGSTDEAQGILDEYKGSDFFTTQIYADIMTRDFVLPYYDVACRLAAARGDMEALKGYIASCGKASEKYGFEKKELSVILDLLEGGYDLPDDMRDELKDRTLDIYEVITRVQSDEYAAMINSPLENGIREQEELYRKELEHRKMVKIYVIVILITIAIISSLTIFIIRTLTDPLTAIGNRRALDQYLHLMAATGRDIHAVMMDVDNFKKVNDTHGHDQGDIVLKRLGALLKQMRTRNIMSFRYGGEEFVMIIKNLDQDAVLRLVENIRKDVGWQTWDFPGRVTVSIGVAAGRSNMETVRQADECMYFSKTHGKNAVAYELNGEKTLLKPS